MTLVPAHAGMNKTCEFKNGGKIMYYLSTFFDNKSQTVLKFKTVDAALKHVRKLYDEKSDYVKLPLKMELDNDGLIDRVTGKIDLDNEHDAKFFALKNGMKNLVFIIDSERSFADGLFELAAEGNPLPKIVETKTAR